MRLSFPQLPDKSAVSAWLDRFMSEFRRFETQIELRDNCKTHWVEYVTNATPDTEDTIPHTLGVTPFMYIWNIDANGVVYDSNRVLWNGTSIRLKCSISSAIVNLLILA